MRWEFDHENDGHHRMIYIIHNTSVGCRFLCVCSLFFCLERCLFVCLFVLSFLHSFLWQGVHLLVSRPAWRRLSKLRSLLFRRMRQHLRRRWRCNYFFFDRYNFFCSTNAIMIHCCSSSTYSFQNTRRRSPNREQLLLQLATAMTSQRYRIQCWTNLFLKTKVTCMLITLRSPSQWDQRQLLEERQQEGQQRRYRVCTRDLLGAAGDSQTGIETKTPCYSDLQFSTKNTQFIWPYQC